MTKQDLLCPISHTLCKDCTLYRGRHYFLPFCKLYGGNYVGKSEENIRPRSINAKDFEAFNNLLEPWRKTQPKADAKMGKLKVIDMEDGGVRLCEFDEAKTWDWDNPTIMRIVDGRQITSWDKLIEISSYLIEKGCQEVELYEAPRFMMLAGG